MTPEDFVQSVREGVDVWWKQLPPEVALTICIMYFVVPFIVIVVASSRKRKRSPPPWFDAAFFHWNEVDALTMRNVVAGGIHAFGRTDSGKTSSMRGVAKGLLLHGASMLVLLPKRGEMSDWMTLIKVTGRENDAVVIHPTRKNHFNFIGYEVERDGEGASSTNATRFVMDMRASVMKQQRGSGGDADFWIAQDERAIGNAIKLLEVAREPITAASMHRMMMSAPDSVATINSKGWQEDYCNSVICKGIASSMSPIQMHDFHIAMDYFLKEWVQLADRTRGSILTGTIATLTALNTGVVREMFGADTTITPKQAIEQRKIILVDMPPDEWGVSGVIANQGWKIHYQKEILRRSISADSPVACIWGDESSIWASDFDATFLSRCRSYRGCMIYLCQSLSNYPDAMPGDKGKAAIEAMLANFSHKLFFALGDHATAKWASDLVGREIQTLGGGSVQRSNELISFMRNSQVSNSFNESWQQIVEPHEFMNGLRTGSHVNNCLVDAILVRSGVPFSNGLPYINVTFDQRS